MPPTHPLLWRTPEQCECVGLEIDPAGAYLTLLDDSPTARQLAWALAEAATRRASQAAGYSPQGIFSRTAPQGLILEMVQLHELYDSHNPQAVAFAQKYGFNPACLPAADRANTETLLAARPVGRGYLVLAGNKYGSFSVVYTLIPPTPELAVG